MSQLRDQLRTAREEYRSASYPGDLAEDVLPARRGRMQIGRWLLLGTGFGAGSLAAAAAIALALVNVLPKQTEQPLSHEVIARVTSSGTFGKLSQLPQQLGHLTTYVPVETIHSTLQYLGVEREQNPADNRTTPPPQDRDHAAA